MQYQNKYNIANEDFLVRGNESLLCPKLGTTFQWPSWSCAEVLFSSSPWPTNQAIVYQQIKQIRFRMPLLASARDAELTANIVFH